MNNDGQFSQGAADSGNAIVHGVASYFNRSMNMTGVGISGTISGGSPVAISGAIRLSSWEDEAVVLAVSGYCINQGATGANASIQVFINGAFTNWQSFMSLPAGAAGSIAASFIAGPQSSSYYQILAQCPNPLLTSGSFWITTNK
jgi:hypothetical protein